MGSQRAERHGYRTRKGHASGEGWNKVGDEILTVDGQPIPAIEAMIETLKRTKDKPVEITVLRDGQQKTFTMQPVLADVPGQQEKRYRVGLGSMPMKVSALPLAAAFRKSIEQNKEGSLLILELVQKMIQRKISIRTIEGPIGIGRAAGRSCHGKRLDPAYGADRRDQPEPRHL